MNEQRQRPIEIASIKNAMIGFLKQAGQNVATLREKEWVNDEIKRLENQGKLTGAKGASQIKATGMVRPVDELGRVVIPAELRGVYAIGPNSPVEIYYDPVTQFICIQKAEKQCHFCGSSKDITIFKGKYICDYCVEDFTNEIIGLEEEIDD